MEQPNEETSFSELADDNVGKIIFLSLVAALGGFLFGFDSGIINGTVEALQGEFNSDEVGTGFNVASMLLGSAVGAFFAGNLADRFGRRPTMILTAVAFIISAWGSGISGTSAVFIVFRVTGGLAVGAASVLAPAYISEIAPAGIRGSLATLQQLMIVVGLFMAFLNNYLIAGAAGSAADVFWLGFDAWQWMFWMEIVPASIFFGTLLFIPESPRYLVAAGREEEARDVIDSQIGRASCRERV
jgi:MFS transporter, SP family, sugar:H+ symporter